MDTLGLFPEKLIKFDEELYLVNNLLAWDLGLLFSLSNYLLEYFLQIVGQSILPRNN